MGCMCCVFFLCACLCVAHVCGLYTVCSIMLSAFYTQHRTYDIILVLYPITVYPSLFASFVVDCCRGTYVSYACAGVPQGPNGGPADGNGGG